MMMMMMLMMLMMMMMMIVSVEQRPGWAEHVCGRSLEMLPDVSSVDAKASSSQLSSLCITYLSSDCCSKHSIPWLSCGLQVPTTSTTMKSKKKRLWSCIAERLSAISDIIFSFTVQCRLYQWRLAMPIQAATCSSSATPELWGQPWGDPISWDFKTSFPKLKL